MSSEYDHRAVHPGAVGAGTRLWFGVEVEGQFTGHRAAFIAEQLNIEELQRLILFLRNAAVLRTRKPVVFFTETFEAWEWAAEHVIPQAPIVCAGRYVSQLEAMLELRQRQPFDRIALLVRLLDQPALLKLSRNDQISVGVPYDMHTFYVGDGCRTLPAHYQGDMEG